ncbi:MAG: hypothetical protein ABII82_12650 [Verrucomicrobiota bacterium]
MPYRFVLAELIGRLGEAAVEAGRRAAEQRRKGKRPRRGGTLRPGPDTVLWNTLVDRVQPLLGERGAKANLARVLSVPRQRIHDYFVARTQMPDAERLLHLLGWLANRETPADASSFPAPRA